MVKRTLISVLTILLLLNTVAFSCSYFVLKAKDNTVVSGRSMEFPVDLKSQIVIIPAGITCDNRDAKGVQGLKWTTKYGFLGINAFDVNDAFVDGFNEKGLSISGLMYTGAKYQSAVPGKFLNLENLSFWVLGNFSNVEEVKKALADVYITGSNQKKLKDMGLHIAITDTSGKTIVIEFIDGQAKVYDNPLGVMTNRPDFGWQMTNLRNYINLNADDKNNREICGVKIEPTGVGSGMLGIPGDWTPPSRFVRIALCKDAALEPNNAKEAVNLSEHLLNIVDIPKGVIKENPKPFITMYGYAQWVITKDLSNRVLYFKAYDDTSWKSVSLDKFDLKPGAARRWVQLDNVKIPATDVSARLK